MRSVIETSHRSIINLICSVSKDFNNAVTPTDVKEHSMRSEDFYKNQSNCYISIWEHDEGKTVNIPAKVQM